MEDTSLPNIIRKVLGPSMTVSDTSGFPFITDPVMEKHAIRHKKIDKLINENSMSSDDDFGMKSSNSWLSHYNN